MAVTDQQLLDLVLNTDCYAELDDTEHGKVEKALAGEPASTPRSNLGRVAFYLARRIVPVQTAPAPPPLPPMTELARNVMFTAWAPDVVLGRLPAHWRVAVTADPGPEGRWDALVRAAAPKIKAAGHLLAVWGNQEQIGAERIRTVARDVGADFVIYQAETEAEYASAVAAGARVIVGNPNAWTQAQRDDATARANRGELAVMFEVYSNAGHPWPDAASSRNVPIVTEVLGVGGWGGAPDTQLDAYQAHTPPGVWATMGVYTAEYLAPVSWALLP